MQVLDLSMNTPSSDQQETRKLSAEDMRILALLDREEKRLRARENFQDFIEYMMPDPQDYDNVLKTSYVSKPVHKLMVRWWEEIDSMKSMRSALSVPPQNGKTTHTTIMGCAWSLGRRPGIKIICGTYNETRAAGNGLAIRRIIESPRYKEVFPEVVLEKGGKSKKLLTTTLGGYILMAGRGSGITGNPCDIFVIDDPVKDQQEATSTNALQEAWDWFSVTAQQRAHNLTRFAIVHCLTGDTQVTMGSGCRKRLDEIKEGDTVLAWEDNAYVKRKVLATAAQGEDDILELKTPNHTIRGNARHPLLVKKGERFEWTAMGLLQKGDEVVCSAIEARNPRGRITAEEAWLLGFMFGDGWLTIRRGKHWCKKGNKHYERKTGIVTCVALSIYEDLNERVLSAFNKLFGIRPKVSKYGYARTEVVKVGKWFQEHGLSGRAKTKQIPKWLFAESLKVRESFIKGFSEADGHYNKSTGMTTIACANYGMVQDLCNLARSCGIIPSNIHIDSFRAKPPHSKEMIEGTTYRFSFGLKKQATAFSTVKIRKVINTGQREPVFDLTVEGSENFIANGLVVHNTRWADNDLIGRICDPNHPEHNPERSRHWTWLNVKAFNNEPHIAEIMGIRPEDYIWPEKFSPEILAQLREMMGEESFSALYMGRPVPEEGGFFRKEFIQIYQPGELPDIKTLRVYASSDHAVTTKNHSNHSVLLVAGVDPSGTVWLLDCVRKKTTSEDIVNEMIRLMKKWRPMTWFAARDQISMSIGPFLKNRMRAEGVYLTHIEDSSEVGNKMQKAQSIRGMMALGLVRFPVRSTWYADMVAELLRFRGEGDAQDDQVDALGHLGRGLHRMTRGSAAPAAANQSGHKPFTIGWVKAGAAADTANRAIERSRAIWR